MIAFRAFIMGACRTSAGAKFPAILEWCRAANSRVVALSMPSAPDLSQIDRGTRWSICAGKGDIEP